MNMDIRAIAKLYGGKDHAFKYQIGSSFYKNEHHFYVGWLGGTVKYTDGKMLRYLTGDLYVYLGYKPDTKPLRARAIYWFNKSNVIFFLKGQNSKWWNMNEERFVTTQDKRPSRTGKENPYINTKSIIHNVFNTKLMVES